MFTARDGLDPSKRKCQTSGARVRKLLQAPGSPEHHFGDSRHGARSKLRFSWLQSHLDIYHTRRWLFFYTRKQVEAVKLSNLWCSHLPFPKTFLDQCCGHLKYGNDRVHGLRFEPTEPKAGLPYRAAAPYCRRGRLNVSGKAVTICDVNCPSSSFGREKRRGGSRCHGTVQHTFHHAAPGGRKIVVPTAVTHGRVIG